jgi:hypothetical protein
LFLRQIGKGERKGLAGRKRGRKEGRKSNEFTGEERTGLPNA